MNRSRLPPLNPLRKRPPPPVGEARPPRAVGHARRGKPDDPHARDASRRGQLFERVNRGILLTAAGRDYLPPVRNAFRQIADASQRVSGAADSGVLTVSVTLFFASAWLVPRLAEFREACPDVDLQVVTSHALADSRATASTSRSVMASALHRAVQRAPADGGDRRARTELVARLGMPATPAGTVGWPQLHDAERKGWHIWFGAQRIDDFGPPRGPRSTTPACCCRRSSPASAAAGRDGARRAGKRRLVQLADVAWLDDFAYYLVYPPHHAERPKVAAFRRWILDAALADGAASMSGARSALRHGARFFADRLTCGPAPITTDQRRETMPALLRRATRIATLSAAFFVACAALPLPAHAYRAPTGYSNEADLDHDTYRNRDGETVHAPAHSKSGRVPDGARAAATARTASAATGAHVLGARRRRRVAVASAEWPIRTVAAARRCQRRSAAKYNSRSRRPHAARRRRASRAARPPNHPTPPRPRAARAVSTTSDFHTEMAQYVFTMNRVGKIEPPKRQILKDISLSFFPGAIGVLGLNGSGKSTLIRIMAGVDKDIEGEATPMPNLNIGYLPQEPQLDPTKTARSRRGRPRRPVPGQQETRGNLRGVRRAGRRLRRARSRAGEVRSDPRRATAAAPEQLEVAADALRLPSWDARIEHLSAAKAPRRAVQAAARKPDMLLLDEPTNHLDAESVDWLEQFLVRFPGTVVAVTHDRYSSTTRPRDSRTRPRSRYSVEGQLQQLARPEGRAPEAGRSVGIGAPEGDQEGTGVGARQNPKGRQGEVEGPSRASRS